MKIKKFFFQQKGRNSFSCPKNFSYEPGRILNEYWLEIYSLTV